MRIINYLIMIIGIVLMIYLTNFDETHSPILMGFSTGLIGGSFIVNRTFIKSDYAPLSSGYTICRMEGKIRLRRKANYEKIHAMEIELGIIPDPRETKRELINASLYHNWMPGGQVPQISPHETPHEIMKEIISCYICEKGVSHPMNERAFQSF